ncbi:sprT-like domain-containing protein Spartan [Asterias rubens]|uniref:sprT-like domain-containing protein Spartan n=1 Tax=Asterias rubens TaxID=7604 RepID=UPI001455C930|nr:sprT-like domain-containing protein Spartan [Asterias rubens]
MSRDKDLELALQLQAQFDREHSTGNHHGIVDLSDESDDIANKNDPSFNFGKVVSVGSSDDDLSRGVGKTESMSIVDKRWELLDPSPDMRAMFLEFNDKYFWGRLAGVEVRWSPRMTLCAGLCCYEGHGGLCSIRLSSPLLKLRPRKDLVETLLHEMIHAYLFVTANNKDHDGHGPEFCKHMNRLNKSTGTSISIYHNFHDEVDVYRQHWWRCDGPCQKRPPYYGMVRRAMNRAPSARDPWWGGHKSTCGGSYTKVKEPEGYGVKKGTKRKKEDPENSGSGNETKKRVTEDASGFPGKGQALGGSSTTSRLLTKDQNTLHKFLKKTEVSPSTSSHIPSRTKSPEKDEQSDSGKENLSKSLRLKALAAIFDSDSSDDEDVVIVKFGNPHPQSNGKDKPALGATQQPTHRYRNTPSSSSPSSSAQGKPTTLPTPRLSTNTSSKQQGASMSNSIREAGDDKTARSIHVAATPQSTHLYKNSSNSSSTSNLGNSTSLPSPRLSTNSSNKQQGASTSNSNREDRDGKKQDSIVDAFGRLRKKSGNLEATSGTNPWTNEPKRTDKSNSTVSRGGVLTFDTEVAAGRQSTDVHDGADMVKCPVCTCEIQQSKINQHLDQCLS